MTKNDFGFGNPEDIPHSPTGRIPKWVTDEAQGKKVKPEPWRAPTTGQVLSFKDHERKRRNKRAIPILVLLVVVLVSIESRTNSQLNRVVYRSSNTVTILPVAPRVFNTPTPGREESSSPIGLPAPLTATNSSYKFIDYQLDNVTPVAFDPCRPIHFVVRTQNEPVGADSILLAAIARISQASGLQFINDGPTQEAPSFRRATFQMDAYGDRWVPVLITWVTEAENPDFVTNAEGETAPSAVSQNSGPKIYVSGSIELDATKLATTLQMPGGAQTVYAVILHELGHLIGLAHVIDPGQLMFPESGHGTIDLAAGDLTGAAILGRGLCAPYL